VGIRKRPLGPNDSLGHCWFGNEKRSRDLCSRQAAEETERECDARFGREDGVTGREDQAEKVVPDVVVDRRLELALGYLMLGAEQLVSHFLVLELEPLAPAQQIDRAMLRGAHQPRARLVGDTRVGPLLERRDERVLRELLREADVADDPGETGDQPGGLDSPDGVDGTMGI
jgi:hypothetical protein